MLLVLNLPLIGLWVKLLTIPKPWLYAGILVFATLGTIGANPWRHRSFELGMLLAFGLLGYGCALPLSDRAGGGRADPRADGGAAAAAALQISQGDPISSDGSLFSSTHRFLWPFSREKPTPNTGRQY
jgi:putative tricarboxylic transport membrane protein